MTEFKHKQPYFLIKFLDPDLTIPVVCTLFWEAQIVSDSGLDTFLFEQIHEDGDLTKLALGAAAARELVVDGPELQRRLAKSFAGTLTHVKT